MGVLTLSFRAGLYTQSSHLYLEPQQPSAANSSAGSSGPWELGSLWHSHHIMGSRWRNECCCGFSDWCTPASWWVGVPPPPPPLLAKPFPAPARPHLLSSTGTFPVPQDAHWWACGTAQACRGWEMWAAHGQWAPSQAPGDQKTQYFRSSSSG